MKCPSCGFEDEGRFCKQCGAPLVSEERAEWVGAPKYTGITIPPPSASQGFKAEDIEELGLEGDQHMASGEMAAGGSETSNSFGLFLVMILIVAIAIFALKMLGGGR